MPRPTALLDVRWLLLVAVWPLLVLGLVSELPAPSDHIDQPAATMPRASRLQQRITGPLPGPCISRPAVLDAIVTAHASIVADGDDLTVEVDVAVESAEGAAPGHRLAAMHTRYAFGLPEALNLPQPVHVQRLNIPLASPPGDGHLALTLVSSLESDGRVTLASREPHLVCDRPSA